MGGKASDTSAGKNFPAAREELELSMTWILQAVVQTCLLGRRDHTLCSQPVTLHSTWLEEGVLTGTVFGCRAEMQRGVEHQNYC